MKALALGMMMVVLVPLVARGAAYDPDSDTYVLEPEEFAQCVEAMEESTTYREALVKEENAHNDLIGRFNVLRTEYADLAKRYADVRTWAIGATWCAGGLAAVTVLLVILLVRG